MGRSGGTLRMGERMRLALLSWPFLLALVTLLVNDHYIKAAYPGFVSGKLSDIAGIFGIALLSFVARPSRPLSIATVLFGSFLWWKSPASQPFIDAVVSLGYPYISRTVDYTDLGAFIVLPLAWHAAGRLEHLQAFDGRFRPVMTIPVLVTSALAVAATSPPQEVTLREEWTIRPSSGAPRLKWSEVSQAVDAAAEKHDMKTRNWRPNAETVRYARRLLTLDWALGADGAVKFTMIGDTESGLFFVDDIPEIMAALKADVRREFRSRFGELEYVELPRPPPVIRGTLTPILPGR
jgi:hypothetical protein